MFRTMIQAQRQQDPNAMSLTLEDMLMMPVQRMPRYELLLNSMMRHTRPSHADHALLRAAHAKIQGLCADFNESKSDAERKHRETRYAFLWVGGVIDMGSALGVSSIKMCSEVLQKKPAVLAELVAKGGKFFPSQNVTNASLPPRSPIQALGRAGRV